jgi:cell volume regulation protein A
MEFGNYLILLCAGLVLLSIFAGLMSSRIGAPLLLVFLGLGMLAGEDGPGGIRFDDFRTAYAIGAASLAIVLFDGGLRTSVDTLRSASWPALGLATVGVAITAALTGAVTVLLFGLDPIEGMLIGSIIASTDAAAVFFLLNLQGTNLVKRVRATLEAESGLNDPMAVFLTVTCVELLRIGTVTPEWSLAPDLIRVFLLQIVGGAAIGLAGGYAMVELINRLKLSPGLYPILALAGALSLFAGAQVLGASGFLAVYLCGIVVGNRRHRARQLIERFQDGIAWLSQIGMFVMLGLLVTPSSLLQNLLPAIVVAVTLTVLARPIAVMICLAPFRFRWREHAFVSWVGLRGAVPIFLGTIPVLAELPGARMYFDVAFVVVLASLLVQGWTINLAARLLNLALPPGSGPPLRFDIDLPQDVGRDMAVFAVQEGSAATRLRPSDLAAAGGAEVVAVMRDGAMQRPSRLSHLAAGDQVIVLSPEEGLSGLDRLFGAAPTGAAVDKHLGVLGEFGFDAGVGVAELGEAYGFQVPSSDRARTAGSFMQRHLRKRPDPGDRLRLGPVELIVRAVSDGAITEIGIELDPESSSPLSRDNIRIWRRHLWRRIRAVADIRRRLRSRG